MRIKKRDFAIPAIARSEINARPKRIESKKIYTRKRKHAKRGEFGD